MLHREPMNGTTTTTIILLYVLLLHMTTLLAAFYVPETCTYAMHATAVPDKCSSVILLGTEYVLPSMLPYYSSRLAQ